MSEITTTISELLATSRQISESAQRVARSRSRRRRRRAAGDTTVDRGNDAIVGTRKQVDLVVGHMLDLGKKSQQIGAVLDIVSELAEQTNILSINATIEAAGAGESGKRFAVVAEEIRKLADRVAGSTKEIRDAHRRRARRGQHDGDDDRDRLEGGRRRAASSSATSRRRSSRSPRWSRPRRTRRARSSCRPSSRRPRSSRSTSRSPTSSQSTRETESQLGADAADRVAAGDAVARPAAPGARGGLTDGAAIPTSTSASRRASCCEQLGKGALELERGEARGRARAARCCGWRTRSRARRAWSSSARSPTWRTRSRTRSRRSARTRDAVPRPTVDTLRGAGRPDPARAWSRSTSRQRRLPPRRAGESRRAPACARPTPEVLPRTLRADLAEVDELLDGVAEAHGQLGALRRSLGPLERARRLAEVLIEQLGSIQHGRAAPPAQKTRSLAEELGSAGGRHRAEPGPRHRADRPRAAPGAPERPAAAAAARGGDARRARAAGARRRREPGPAHRLREPGRRRAPRRRRAGQRAERAGAGGAQRGRARHRAGGRARRRRQAARRQGAPRDRSPREPRGLPLQRRRARHRPAGGAPRRRARAVGHRGEPARRRRASCACCSRAASAPRAR